MFKCLGNNILNLVEGDNVHRLHVVFKGGDFVLQIVGAHFVIFYDARDLQFFDSVSRLHFLIGWNMIQRKIRLLDQSVFTMMTSYSGHWIIMYGLGNSQKKTGHISTRDVPDCDKLGRSPEQSVHFHRSDRFFHLFQRGLVVPWLDVEDDVALRDHFALLVFFRRLARIVGGDSLGLGSSELQSVTYSTPRLTGENVTNVSDIFENSILENAWHLKENKTYFKCHTGRLLQLFVSKNELLEKVRSCWPCCSDKALMDSSITGIH